MKGIYVLGNLGNFDLIYGPDVRAELASRIDIAPTHYTPEDIARDPEILRGVDFIFSGWGCVTFTPELMAHADKLAYLFYGAGSIRAIVTDAFWERGVRVSAAWRVNGEFVADFTYAQILLSLKMAYRATRDVNAARSFDRAVTREMPGLNASTVGIVSLGTIGRSVCERLRRHGFTVLAYDPYAPAADAAALGATPVSLEELFARSDVVSLHTPWLPETVGMITRELIASMKRGATLINTSRGAVIDEPAMIEVLLRRPDLTALLDVTHPEPPVSDSPLYTMPNVYMTPHIAGACGAECRAMGRMMADELNRYLSGQPQLCEVTRAMARTMA